MMPWYWILAITVYGVLNVYCALYCLFYSFCLIQYEDSDPCVVFLPWKLHGISSLNWFGCVLASALLIALLPAVWIPRLLWWLVTAGRGDRD